jgi:hypothetical protein
LNEIVKVEVLDQGLKIITDVKTLDEKPLQSVKIVTQSDPLNARPDDEFGFSDTITEFK